MDVKKSGCKAVLGRNVLI